jgi:L-aspartate oxidase
VELHIKDTLAAGQGLCKKALVRQIITEGPAAVEELIRWGARFDRRRGGFSLAQEGGHSCPRSLHAGGDRTGVVIVNTLRAVIASRPQIQVMEHTFAIDLLVEQGRCVGCLIYDVTYGLRLLVAEKTILATGGAGQVYRETTNPPIATGDGLAMAYRAGARVMDMEFVQFHPTALYVAGAARELISEIVRGAGATLEDRFGHRFMFDYHPRGELAPRDVVSRAIVAQMAKTGDTHAYLNLSPLGVNMIKKQFPHLVELCKGVGIDIARDRIPVRPSAHYSIGGVVVDRFARTDIDGLYACGEVAGTGFHGANRLGCNSLLEGLVTGKRAGEHAGSALTGRVVGVPKISYRLREDSRGAIDVVDMLNSLKSLMWRAAGVERSEGDLKEALEKISYWSSYVLRRQFLVPRGWELENLLLVGALIVEGALRRRESRGVHYRKDYPRPAGTTGRHLVQQRGSAARWE